MSAQDVEAEVRRWVGTPYRVGGRTRGVAADCLGVVAGTGVALGLLCPDVLATAWTPHTSEAVARQLVAVHAAPCPTDAPRTGEIVLCRCVGGVAMHAGILVAEGTRWVHALNSVGCVVEAAWEGAWRRRCVGAWRFAGCAA